MTIFLNRAEWVETPNHELSFRYADSSCGFRFPCDEKGNVNVDALAPEARCNYEKCLANTHDKPVVNEGVVVWVSRYKTPAKIRCDCGSPLELVDSMTNECGCGRFYNGSGQALSHPSQWGEETGERFDARGNPIF